MEENIDMVDKLGMVHKMATVNKINMVDNIYMADKLNMVDNIEFSATFWLLEAASFRIWYDWIAQG